MVALTVTLPLHAHTHAAWFFSDGQVFDVLHVLGLRDEFNIVLFYFLVSLDISEGPCGIGVDMVEAVFCIWSERDPAFVVEAGDLMGVLVSHCFFSLIL